MVLFIMLCKVVLTFKSVDEIIKCDIQMKVLSRPFDDNVVLCVCPCSFTGKSDT